MLFTLLVILIVVDAILLSIVVLLQSGKGGGLAGIAAGGQATQILGARQAPDFLEKASWTLGTALLVLCFVAPFTVGADRQRSVLEDTPVEAPVEAPALPGTEAPAAPPAADVPPPGGDAAPSETE